VIPSLAPSLPLLCLFCGCVCALCFPLVRHFSSSLAPFLPSYLALFEMLVGNKHVIFLIISNRLYLSLTSPSLPPSLPSPRCATSASPARCPTCVSQAHRRHLPLTPPFFPPSFPPSLPPSPPQVCVFGLSRKVPDVRFLKHTGDIYRVPFSRICNTALTHPSLPPSLPTPGV